MGTKKIMNTKEHQFLLWKLGIFIVKNSELSFLFMEQYIGNIANQRIFEKLD